VDARTIIWVRAGGRCVICRRYLLDDDQGEVVPIGEVAHIVGRTTGDRSPRGDHPLPVGDRDDPPNLMLLCRDDHRLADSRQLADRRYTVTFLERLKVEHETNVRRLTGLLADRGSVVFRLLGSVRGELADVGRRQVDAALTATDRFPRYLDDSHHNTVDVDLRELPEDAPSYWETATHAIDRGVRRLAGAVHSGDHAHASVFAMARLPLLVHLGAALGDAIPIEVYQRHREHDTWVWPEAADPIDFEHTDGDANRADEDAAVIIANVSGVIHPGELPGQLQHLPIYEVRPRDARPAHDLVSSPTTRDAFEQTFRALLTELERTAKNIRHLHLFLALPVSLAVTVGRTFDPQVHPHVHVYDRGVDGYAHVLDLPNRDQARQEST
jgi:hypothetical protein